MEFYVIYVKNSSGVDSYYDQNNSNYAPNLVADVLKATKFKPKDDENEAMFAARLLKIIAETFSRNTGYRESACIKKVSVAVGEPVSDAWEAAYIENALSKLSWKEAESLGIQDQMAQRKISK